MHRPFSDRLLAWFDVYGRHDLPWQHPREPYRVWLAEVMLQQTQVATVIPYFERFLLRFPDVATLAAAPLDDVLALWSGLGYYARARNLHRCAKALVSDFGGRFPRNLQQAMDLPGLGRSTAAAVLAQAYGERHAILDGNVRRVFSRHALIAGWPGRPAVQAELWRIADAHLPEQRLADYTQALMDLGATLCTRHTPDCSRCPVAEDCEAFQRGVTAAYPEARPRRSRPRRVSRLLLLVQGDDDRLLLERRPPVGVWGGLWSPPILEGIESPSELDWCRSHLLTPLGDVQSLPTVTHAFTHFDLDIHPKRLRVNRVDAIRESDQWRWVTIPDLSDLGLPAPVRKLLMNPAG